jgi:hypothetical protein
MKFGQFTTLLGEAKFRKLPQYIIDQVNKLARVYIQRYNSNNVDVNNLLQKGKIVSFKDNKRYRTYFKYFQLKQMPVYFTPATNLMGKVVVKDLQTNEKKTIDVYCVYGDIGDVEYAAYGHSYETINLYDNNIKDLSDQAIASKIIHEITHGFQQYKDYSQKYLTSTDEKEPIDAELYYNEPIEVDSHLNEIAFNIINKFKQLNKAVAKAEQPASKMIFQKRIDYLLKELKVFAQAPLEVYLDLEELPLPSFTETMEEFLRAVSKNERLKNKFKLKMVDLYNKLSAVND